MTDFTTHTVATAPVGSAPLLEGAEQAFSFIPNLLGTMAEAPAMLEGYMTLAGIFDKTDLTETERQIILMTNNRLNGCVYCMAAHTTLSQMANVPADVIDALRNNTPIADTKLEVLRTFAAVINESRGWPTDEQVNVFLAAGYTRQTVLEVILGTSLKVMSNYTNHVASTDVDAAFAPNAWSAPAQQAAE
ncbi:carboxymuconolactone decarboxylase family protein [Leisingera sp. SS27]|uniref:carboxymuconolactone decarboxylase family protein n=1 Tax=Leisingera sp. SS27 TaxID=2979462 RepID=UPI00232CB91A|nr:carboxymuconolactone decarboxylase family protein [Leisingera sp. SS27]MDC0660553.1 carboxymuconolactone decarboxylase family protein [Leisingera sp. SS27]